MVQVDVFWSYAMGAGFAAAASRQILAAKKNSTGPLTGETGLLRNGFFAATVIYLGALFAPSGVGLLWAFPSWETMHAGDRNLPTWLVMLFGITNVTQGILGFWVTKKLVEAEKHFAAAMQMVIGYFFMFFILVHGWDGSGYKRFFSATHDNFVAWNIWNIPRWLVSDVALTLYGMGIVLLPVMFYLMSKWIIEGRLQEGLPPTEPIPTRFPILKAGILSILGGALVFAIVESILVRYLGCVIGTIVFIVLAYIAALRKGGYLRKWLAALLLRDPATF